MPDIDLSIAIVAISLRFPGASTVGEFWENLRNGVESITFMSEADCDLFKIPADRRGRGFIPAEGIPKLGHSFRPDDFGLPTVQASVIDPQQSLFIQCASEVLKEAGSSTVEAGRTGVFVGYSMFGYTLSTWPLPPVRLSVASPNFRYATIFNSVANFVSYTLNLTGPSVDIQAGSPSSLVAVHFACQSLLHFEVDFCIAGGVSYKDQSQRGYTYTKGDIFSADGHCRAFDERASGTVPGTGAGCLGLMRLPDALASALPIHAVVLGTAVNNDGSMKIGYTAPSVEGQAEVVAQALAVAGVHPTDLGYLEAHGTGTLIGDPVEVAALKKVWASSGHNNHLCGLGSVKTNIGHLDAAAGIAGLIKTVLALKNRTLPATLHFENPSPYLGLQDSPFYVTATASDWESQSTPRCAGVSSFGIGGTNAHAILAEFTSWEEFKRRTSHMTHNEPHVFISYVREDSSLVDRLCQDLASQGIIVWRDQNDIPPGKRWKQEIAKAIQSGGFFIACFSQSYHQRDSTYMNEELVLAIEELRRRPTDRAWFLPVLLSDCELPARTIGAGETLRDLQAVALFNDWKAGVRRIISTIKG